MVPCSNKADPGANLGGGCTASIIPKPSKVEGEASPAHTSPPQDSP